MRYFIFLFCVLLHSCALFKHNHSSEQEKKQVSNDSVPVETKHVVDLRIAADTITGSTQGASVNPDLLIYSAAIALPTDYPWIYSGVEARNIAWYPQLNFTALLVAPVKLTVTDSFPPAVGSIDTNSNVPVKVIPKPSATILPEPKSFVMPYIASGIAAIFLGALFFWFMKRRKK